MAEVEPELGKYKISYSRIFNKSVAGNLVSFLQSTGTLIKD